MSHTHAEHTARLDNLNYEGLTQAGFNTKSIKTTYLMYLLVLGKSYIWGRRRAWLPLAIISCLTRPCLKYLICPPSRLFSAI